MSKKVCKICGKRFEAFKEEFDTCSKCIKNGGVKKQEKGEPAMQGRQDRYQPERRNPSYSNSPSTLPPQLKLPNGFYDENGAIRREVYDSVSLEIANQFNRDNLTTSSVRPFFESVRVTYENYLQDPEKSYPKAIEKLYRLLPLANYKQQRRITNSYFTSFIQHYIDLTTQEPRNLRAFKELFMSIIGYMKK
ncbi:MAG: type III-A CRISPR-associated protein Csm2 [bacterium]|jgi:CRISPR type III-A-associated protein Csm2